MPGAMPLLYTLPATRSVMLADGPSAKEQAVMAQHLAYLRELKKPGGVGWSNIKFRCKCLWHSDLAGRFRVRSPSHHAG
jgi:hypothetical protein